MQRWLERHPIIATGVVVVVFLVWSLPEWLGQVWPLFTDKTLPVWLDERGWAGMTDLIGLLRSAVSLLYTPIITFIMLGFLWSIVRQQKNKGIEQPGQGQNEHRKNREQFVNSFDAYRQLYDLINRGDDQEIVHVRVVYVDQEGVSLARVLQDLFERTGYEVELLPIQEHVSHIQGIKIHGCNVELVDGVTRALRSARLLEVQSVIERPEVSRENAQWDKEHYSLRIVIGCCP